MSDTDLELLARYTRHHAEDAFAEVVRRHLDLVHSAAFRQVRFPQLAEEVAQSTFIKLARHAQQLPPDTILTAWLYQVTRRTAIDVVRREARRQLREQVATEMNTLNATAADWTHIEPLLDEAMHALDETDRTAVLLRYFENKSIREVGATLGTSENAAQTRLSRAVERLRQFFTKRGVTVGASGLAVVISANAVQAAPVGLVLTISTAAALGGTTIAATATATKAIAMTTTQKVLIAAVLAAAVGTGIYEARKASTFRNQLSALQQQQTALNEQLTSDRDEATRQLAALRAENERLKGNTSELLKLRGEVTQLRPLLVEAATKRPAPSVVPAVPTEAEQPSEPVQIFVANADASVPAGQTLAFGGWATPPGKRTIVFVLPKIEEGTRADHAGSISLESRYLEVPEGTLAQVVSDLNLAGLEKLKAESKASSVQSLFTAAEAALILKTLENTAGVDVLSSPKVLTGNGRQAIISITQQKTIEGQEHTLGPSLDVEPRIAADGFSVNLTVSARLKKANPAQQITP
ncbi:MAG: sigma-70 family RNA polymerase sigma factor [Verrucomicrobiales bacterium]|nr:sigma-70 family RNA polymerase sigma factor [Verrucomicrobiales bacterium]